MIFFTFFPDYKRNFNVNGNSIFSDLILKKYYSKLFVIRKTFSQFFRMTRNFVFYNLFGKEIFLKLRMKRLKKNG